jgi:Gamma tubulin complex component C-terminal
MTKSASISASITENPVHTILNKILKLTEQFTAFAYHCGSPMNEEECQSYNNFEEIFKSLVASFFYMLSGLQSAQLSQFLLRLDFNYWFSKNQNEFNN